jgi:hypothetical protein
MSDEIKHFSHAEVDKRGFPFPVSIRVVEEATGEVVFDCHSAKANFVMVVWDKEKEFINTVIKCSNDGLKSAVEILKYHIHEEDESCH